MDAETQARLDAIESREQIRELPAKYVWASARADVPAMVALFTKDCDFESGPPEGRMKLKGQKAVLEFLTRMVPRPGAIIALIHNQTVELDGETATGTCVMHNPVAAPEMSPFVGYYKDEFQRVDGVWLFSARRFWNYAPKLDLSGG